jgi:hypothetical protein
MIRQRVLYVGIGGTGLDLGVHLHEALQREICGPDGRALNRFGTFSNLPPNQLPSFVQYLLLDFNIDSLNGAVRAMSGGNVTVARSVQPGLNNYPAVATQLRLREFNKVESWIPNPPSAPYKEPPVKPYTAGAGQYPTVGRAALFSAISNNGYGPTIGNDIQNALRNLGNSLGELSAYSSSHVADIAVYVGFSLSGGTGAGLFIDVLQLLINELSTQLSGNKVTIIPIVYLPSTFDGVLNPAMRKRAELNCAQGILDLQSLVASRQNHVPTLTNMFTIDYPGGLKISNAQLGNDEPQFPAISVVRKAAGMRQDDLGRAVAASVVAQLSYDTQKQTVDGQKTSNGFAADIINKVQDISRAHKLGLGTHCLMPMIASSLTVPTQRIADIIAKNILVKGMEEQKKHLDNGLNKAAEDSIDNFLRQMGLAKIVDVETYAVENDISFTPNQLPKTEADLQQQIIQKKRQVSNSLQATKNRVEAEVKKMATFNFAEAFGIYMSALDQEDASIVNALDVAKQALDRLESNTARRSPAQGGNGLQKKKKGMFSGLLPQKVSAKRVTDAFNQVEADHRRQVEDFWWGSWNDARVIWGPWVQQGRDFLDKITKMLSKFNDEALDEVKGLVNELEKADNGVVFYVPTEGRELDAQIKLIEDVALRKVRADLGIQNTSVGALFTKVVAEGGGWTNAINLMRTDSPMSSVHEAILEPIRSRIQEAVQPRDGSPGAMKGLPELLKSAVSQNGSESEDTRDLIRKIGNLVPGHIIPTGRYQECRVLITYPGERDPMIEEFIKKYVALDGEFAAIIEKSENKDKNSLEFIPTGLGDTIRVNINMIGQGLLDNPEIKSILASWVSELSNPMDEDLIWRQRLGYKNVGRIFDVDDRDKVVAAIVRGLANGQIQITEGTVQNPKKIRIRHSNPIQSDLIDTFIDVLPMGELSPWPNVVNGFEKLILEINEDNDFRAEVVETLNVSGAAKKSSDGYAPKFELTQIPEILYELVELQKSELVKIDSDMKNSKSFGADWMRSLSSSEEFWAKTFDKALDVKIDAGKYATLREAMASMPRSN